jgi:hypothetical protein
MIIFPVIVSVPIDKKDYSKKPVSLLNFSHFKRVIAFHSGEKKLIDILHLVCHTDKTEEHVKSCPERCNILRFYSKNKRFLPFKPAAGV